MTIKAILTDIEGTTSSISFVHEVLFPYAASRLEAFVREHLSDDEVQAQLTAVSVESGIDVRDVDALCRQLLDWIREDKKITPLKALQGMIWKHGYAQGDFTGHVYQDAADNLKSWHEQGLKLYVYSSGSVAAQKLIFGYSDFGDLTPLFSDYFDTKIGGKKEAASYAGIVEKIGLPAEEILFLSDVPDELDAAAASGLKVCHLVRVDEVTKQDRYPVAATFDEVRATFALV
ncbi:2,3-diketo-5-methylthio-1-phosphopentane phosphatase [Hahella sp. CCB-MM4]|uniref:acireductone synthase n=1 Tax=Hahella sp. (strain CCB-MM4) TaxID=1926491 RepID=UPI000B9BFE16|nr:acireductone synthase [Hahella sp. CCB-MM4]OZG72447.1 2,3-diketo-5-methylthio-1-phosphopentane phosphatase [Hahella sp. CCB-MM4]